jgi:hypothetical protein
MHGASKSGSTGVVVSTLDCGLVHENFLMSAAPLLKLDDIISLLFLGEPGWKKLRTD